MAPMTDLPDPRHLNRLPNARLMARAILILSVPLFVGIHLLLVLSVTLAAPEGGPWMPVGVLTLGFLMSLLLFFEASIFWNNHRRARRLLQVPLPDAPGVWFPERAPLSAHGRLALAQVAPVPTDWAIGHDGRHAYVVERRFGRWRCLTRRLR